MRLPGRTIEDPLLRIGAAALAIALLFTAVAAYALLRERPAEAADRAVRTAAFSEPLVRSDPGIEEWVEEDVPPPRIGVGTRTAAPTRSGAGACGVRPDRAATGA